MKKQNIMYFPSSYKKALLNKTKNVTIRTSEEMKKYKKDKIYNAFSYAGRDWDICLKTIDVFKIKVKNLDSLGLKNRNINSLIKKENISSEDRVQFIKFKVL